MNKNRFLKKEEIKNFDLIIDIIIENSRSKETTINTPCFEHLGELFYLLDRYDKKRKPDDPELKKATFAILRRLFESKKVRLYYDNYWSETTVDKYPKTEAELFEFLDKNWGTDNVLRSYLVWFEKVED